MSLRRRRKLLFLVCSSTCRSPTLHIRDNFYDLYFHQRLGKCCLRLLLLLIFPSLCSLWLHVMRCGTRELNGIGYARKNTQSFCLLWCKLRSENRCKRFTKLKSFIDHPNENCQLELVITGTVHRFSRLGALVKTFEIWLDEIIWTL